MKTSLKSVFASALISAAFASCSKSENTPANPGNFIIAATPVSSTATADYLLTASSLDTGKVSTTGQGVEQDGTYRYYVTHNNKFFSMLYGQGNPGAVTAYNIVDGKLNKLTNFQTETVQAFAPVNDDLLLVKLPRSLETPNALWYQVSTESLSITAQGTFDATKLANNGEIAHFSWIKQVGNKVFAPFFCITDRNFNTSFPNTAWIAVFSYPEMKFEKLITDNRTSFIGKYFTDGLAETENGDVYAYSPAVAAKDGNLTSTVKSAITRLKSGTTEFDQSYYIDFEEISGGNNITNWIYVGNNNFVTYSTTKAEKGAYVTGLNVGILNVVNKTYKAVTGMPNKEKIVDLTDTNYTPRDGRTAYIGVNTTEGNYVYKIDASTGTATRGLAVEGGMITAIQHLD